MKENWEKLIGKRILLRKKYLTNTYITEATVVEISESGKYVKFRWESGSESWQVPEDEYSFSYDKLLEVLGPAPEEREAEKKSEEEKAYTQKMLDRARAKADEKDQTIRITFPEEVSEQESGIDNGGIYETLKPNECYLITKKGDSVLVVANKDGKIEVKWVPATNEDDAMAAIHAIGAGRAIGSGINTLLKMLSEQESTIAKEKKTEIGSESSTGTLGPKFNIIPIKEKEPDIVSNPLTGKIEPIDDNTTSPMQKSKLDSTSIKYKIDNF